MNTRVLTRHLKALANERRLAILKELKKRKTASVTTLADAINLSFRSTSKHLSVLSHADIVQFRKRGRVVMYRLSIPQSPEVRHILKLL